MTTSRDKLVPTRVIDSCVHESNVAVSAVRQQKMLYYSSWMYPHPSSCCSCCDCDVQCNSVECLWNDESSIDTLEVRQDKSHPHQCWSARRRRRAANLLLWAYWADIYIKRSLFWSALVIACLSNNAAIGLFTSSKTTRREMVLQNSRDKVCLLLLRYRFTRTKLPLSMVLSPLSRRTKERGGL